MAVVSRQSKRFAASSPVTRYWLANCVGFKLAGRGQGTVERILSDVDPFTPSALVVRSRHHKLRRVPVSAVVEVVPSERVLVVGGTSHVRAVRSHERRDRLREALRLGRSAAVAAGALLLLALLRLAELAREVWRVGYPVVSAGARRGGRETVRLVRSVPWQRYGRSARSATTRLLQVLSSRSSPRRTTSSEKPSATSSGERARTTSST